MASDRLLCELELIRAMYPDVSVSESATGIHVEHSTGSVRLCVSLTPEYPDTAAPSVEVSAPNLPAADLDEMRTTLSKLCVRDECLMEILAAADDRGHDAPNSSATAPPRFSRSLEADLRHFYCCWKEHRRLGTRTQSGTWARRARSNTYPMTPSHSGLPRREPSATGPWRACSV